jgi:4-carboxymuconolactone decarboxylase
MTAKFWVSSAFILHPFHSKSLLTRTVRPFSLKTQDYLMSLMNTKTEEEKTNEKESTTTPFDYPRTSVGFEPRYAGPSEDDMTEDQRQIRDAIVATRKRTGLSGPFGPWLAIPAIADPAQSLGRACRYETSLSFQESELVILLTGAKMKSHSEFDIHVGEALKSGWTYDTIAAIPRDDDFSLDAVKEKVLPKLENDRQRAIATFAAELLETCTVSDDTYDSTKQVLDGKDSVLVEITSIVGYYTYVSYTLNVFRIPSQSSAKKETKRKRED